MADKKRKIRADFRKNRQARPRRSDLTRDFQDHGFQQDDSARSERVSGKGALSRKRTIVVTDSSQTSDAEGQVLPEVNREHCLAGTVLSVGGLQSPVQVDNGVIYQCATRRLLKTLSTDQRHVLAA